MKTISYLFLFLILTTGSYAQDATTEKLKALHDQEQFDKIIKDHADKVNEYSAAVVFQVGKAYFMLQQDNDCLKMMDLALKKDGSFADAYYMKGVVYSYMSQFKKSAKLIKKAIDIDPNKSEYWSALGDAHISIENYDEALSAYEKATQQEDKTERPFVMIPQIYAALGQDKKALKSFYTAKENVAEKSTYYPNVVYNIGLFEYQAKDYKAAEEHFLQSIEIDPNDYQSFEKLIKVYYAQKAYEKAEHYREKLYEAYQNGRLDKAWNGMFCFDEFEWKGQSVRVFEKFEEPEGELYYKHLFYLLDKNNEIELRIQTENSPISVELGGPKYLLGMNKGNTHYTFEIGFNEKFDYEELKKAVVKILDEKVKPAASSRKNK